MGVIPIDLGPFSEGVNLVDPKTRLSEKELSECLNIRIGIRGNLSKRPGFDKYGATATKVNGDNFTNLAARFYKSDGSKKLIAAAGGKLKYGDDALGTWTELSCNGVGAGVHVSNLIDWMVYKDRFYLADGTQPQRYPDADAGDDTIFTGHYSHAAPTLAQAAGGNLTLLATYKYVVASIAGDLGEGPSGAVATITLSGANNRVNLSAMAAAPARNGETFKAIYRTKANGSLYYLLTTITSATTVYQDNTADGALGEEYVPVHAPRANARFVIMGHDERAYWFGRSGLDASTVEVSDVGFPDRILDTDSFTVANNDGDIITGGGLVPGGIVFFKKTSMWLSRAFGYGLINIYPKEKRGSGVGTTSPFSIVTTPVGLIFLSQSGEVYKFDGTNIEEIGRKVASEFQGMTQATRGRVVSCYHNYRYVISYDFRGSKGYNWKTFEYNTLTDRWEGPYENHPYYTPSYYSVWDSVLDSGELVWGEARAANGSYVWKRTEFTKLDRGNRFISRARSGALPLAKLGEIKSTKFFVHGTIASDARLTAAHIDEVGNRTSVDMTTPVAFSASKLNGTDNLGSTAPVFKLGGATASILEGPLGPGARSRIPIYEITDGGSAIEFDIDVMSLLVEALPLK